MADKISTCYVWNIFLNGGSKSSGKSGFPSCDDISNLG